jgi:TonB family protein
MIVAARKMENRAMHHRLQGFILCAMSLAPAVATAGERPPHAIGTLPIFSQDDYPDAALRANQQGRVVVRLSVDATGKIVGCSLEETSGSLFLDVRTCQLFMRRARFDPVESGAVVVPRSIVQKINWLIPGQPAPSPLSRPATPDEKSAFDRALAQASISVLTWIKVREDGHAISCEVREAGTNPAMNQNVCALLLTHLVVPRNPKWSVTYTDAHTGERVNVIERERDVGREMRVGYAQWTAWAASPAAR